LFLNEFNLKDFGLYLRNTVQNNSQMTQLYCFNLTLGSCLWIFVKKSTKTPEKERPYVAHAWPRPFKVFNQAVQLGRAGLLGREMTMIDGMV
jgi:hypothetical protein